MAKKGMIEREKKRQALVKKFFKKRSFLKDKLKSLSTFEEILETQKSIQKLPRDSSATRLHNRCWKTGRPKAYYRFFGLSRHVLREMAHEGLLPGVIKASW